MVRKLLERCHGFIANGVVKQTVLILQMRNKQLPGVYEKLKVDLSHQFRSKAVVLLWFSVAFFGVRVSVTFHFMFVHIIF